MKKIIATFASFILIISMTACNKSSTVTLDTSTDSAQTAIENTLNLANNPDQEWTYAADADAWVLSVVSTVVNPELSDQQGVSISTPGAYVKGIDTNGDGTVDIDATTYV